MTTSMKRIKNAEKEMELQNTIETPVVKETRCSCLQEELAEEKEALSTKSQMCPSDIPTASNEMDIEMPEEIMVWIGRIVIRDQKIAKLQREINNYRSALIEKEAEIARKLLSVSQEHDQNIEAIHILYRGSTSWKVTAPLRFISSIKRKIL